MAKPGEAAAEEEFKAITGGGQTPTAVGVAGAAPEIGRGTVIGRYTVLERLEADASATVFSAYDAQLERVVAWKILRLHTNTPEARSRLLREAQAMARLKHRHIVTVYDVGTFGEGIYIATELIDGSTLRRWLEEPRPWREVLEVLKAAGRGLAAAHEAGLVHGHFKPDSVLVGKDGRVLVTDFGLLRREQATSEAGLVPPEGADPSEMATHPRVTARPAADHSEDTTLVDRVDLRTLGGDAAANGAQSGSAGSTRPTSRENGARPDPTRAEISDVDDDEATLARRVDLAELKTQTTDAAAERGALNGTDADKNGTAAQPDATGDEGDDDATIAFKAKAPPATDDEETLAFKVNKVRSKPPVAADGVPGPTPAPSSTPSTAPPTRDAAMATSGYIAPEYFLAGEDDAKSDQFSFAVTMYVALYGQQPFRFDNLSTYREAVQRAPEAPPPSTVPAWIHAVIERGLRRRPQDRFASMASLLEALEKDPSRGRRSWMLGIGAVAACVLGLVGYDRHRSELREQCEQGAPMIATIWNPGVEQQTRDAIARAGGVHGADIATRVAARLASFSERWAAAYRQVAEATLLRGQQDAATMDRRLACLERARDQMAALTEILSRPDAAVARHAIDAAFSLPSPDACATSDVSSIPPLPAPELRASVRAGERAIVQATAYNQTGQEGKAEEIIDGALATARSIAYPRTEAELLLIQSDSILGRGDPRAAFESATSALQAAERAGDHHLAARAATRVAYLLGAWLDKPREAERWQNLAEAIADGAGHDDDLDVALLANRIAVNATLGHPESNVGLQDKCIALMERLYAKQDPRVARAVANRGSTYYSTGNFERALEDIQSGLALMISVAGPDYPHLALEYSNLGAALIALGRLQEAKEAYEHALSLEEGGSADALTVTTLGALAGLELELGTPESAMAIGERGLRAAEAAGEKGVLEWGLRLTIANAKGKMGDLAGKADDCRKIVELQKAAGALTHEAPYTPDALACLGQAEIALHRVEAALDHLERSASFTLRSEPGDLPRARFALAKALRIAGRDAIRARELAESARDAFRRLPALAKDLAEAEQWLVAPAPAAGPTAPAAVTATLATAPENAVKPAAERTTTPPAAQEESPAEER